MRHLPRDERCDVSRSGIGFECFVIRGESAVKSSVDDSQMKKSYISGDQTTGIVTNVFMSVIEILHKAAPRHHHRHAQAKPAHGNSIPLFNRRKYGLLQGAYDRHSKRSYSFAACSRSTNRYPT